MNMRRRFIGSGLAATVIVTTSAAFATTGGLTAQDCIAATGNNPGGCATTTPGLTQDQSIVLSPDGKSAYVTALSDNAIVRFTRNTTTGVLTAAGCIADVGSNPAGCGTTAKGLLGAADVAVSPDGKSVYVAANGTAIVRFARDTTSGALTFQGCTADVGNNFDGCGATTKGLNGARAVAVSADGKSVYVASSHDNALVTFSRNTTTGGLTAQGCIAATANNPDGCGATTKGLGFAYDLTLSSDDKSAYVVSFSDSALVRFTRNTTTGALTPAGCIGAVGHNPAGCGTTTKGLHGASGLTVSHDGATLYATSLLDSAVVRFTRNTTSGALTAVGCRADSGQNPAGCGVTAQGLVEAGTVTVSGDGKNVFVGTAFDLVTFSRNTTSGALTPTGCISDTGGNPQACGETTPGLRGAGEIVVSNSGKWVYVTAPADNAIVRFSRVP